MLAYRVDDMTCGRCASAITRAIRAVDTSAQVEVDLAQHLVRVQPTAAGTAALTKAITDAGYTPVPVSPTQRPEPAPRTGGCCCGSNTKSCG